MSENHFGWIGFWKQIIDEDERNAKRRKSKRKRHPIRD